MDNIEKDGINKIKIILSLLLIFAILISIFGFYRDFRNTFKYGGIDLRARVVGARLLLEGIDPYHYKWNENDSELLFDPMDTLDRPVSRVTRPPALLAIHSIMAPLPYNIQRIIWFFLQWIFLLTSILLFSLSTNSEFKKKLIWILGLLFISGNSFWRLHVERGQIYILYIFLIALAFWLSNKKFRLNHILSGFVIGFTASLRPIVIFMSLPMLIYKKWKLLIGTVIGLVAGLATPLLITNIFVWKEYYNAMQFWGRNPHIFGNRWGELYSSLYPDRIIEGMHNIASGAGVLTTDSSIQSIFIRYIGIKLYPTTLIIILISILIIFSMMLFIIRRREISMNLLFLISSGLVFISEYFLPAARYSYTNVIWLLPLSLIIINYNPLSSMLHKPIIFLFLGLFFSISIPFAPGGSLAGDASIVFYTIFAIIFFLRKNWQDENRNSLKA